MAAVTSWCCPGSVHELTFFLQFSRLTDIAYARDTCSEPILSQVCLRSTAQTLRSHPYAGGENFVGALSADAVFEMRGQALQQLLDVHVPVRVPHLV